MNAARSTSERTLAARCRGATHDPGQPQMTAPGDSAGAAAATCRNCGASSPGRYCPQCGQETNLALPSAAAFLREATGRYVAFAGRMWRTLGNLVLRPGLLTREYLAGRRRRYVRPAKLFIALSIMMFAVFHLGGHPPGVMETDAIRSESEAKPGASDHKPDVVQVVPDLELDFGSNEDLSRRLAPLR